MNRLSFVHHPAAVGGCSGERSRRHERKGREEGNREGVKVAVQDQDVDVNVLVCVCLINILIDDAVISR